jgi:hypothetical protein
MNNCRLCGMYYEKLPEKCLCYKCGTKMCDQEPQPNIIQKAINFTASVVKHVANGMESASSAVKQERMTICKSCPFFNNTDPKNPTCNKCWCFLEIKTSWASEKCPEGKWHDIKTASNGGCGCQKT